MEVNLKLTEDKIPKFLMAALLDYSTYVMDSGKTWNQISIAEVRYFSEEWFAGWKLASARFCENKMCMTAEKVEG